MTFARRQIDLTFALGEGDFGEGGADTVEITGLRVSVNIQRTGGASFSTANIRAYGMPPSVMNKISTLRQIYPDVRKNTVTVRAGDDESGKGIVFSGQIAAAYADFAGAPDAAFTVDAWTMLVDGLKPVKPSTFPGPTDAAVIARGLADMMGYELENYGVQTVIASPYFSGTAKQQLAALARAGGFEAFLDDTAVPPAVVIIAPGQTRGGVVPLIAPWTGLVGYPAYVQNAVGFTTLYNPNIRFRGNVEIDTELTPAKGSWNVYEISHELESENPSGPWFTHAKGILFGNEAPG